MKYNSFCFFRAYFNIPKRIKLAWCVVKEYTKVEGVRISLGIALKIEFPFYSDLLELVQFSDYFVIEPQSVTQEVY